MRDVGVGQSNQGMLLMMTYDGLTCMMTYLPTYIQELWKGVKEQVISLLPNLNDDDDDDDDVAEAKEEAVSSIITSSGRSISITKGGLYVEEIAGMMIDDILKSEKGLALIEEARAKWQELFKEFQVCI